MTPTRHDDPTAETEDAPRIEASGDETLVERAASNEIPSNETDPESTADTPVPESEVARRIEELAYTDLAENAFFERWLELLAGLPEVRDGAVWTLNTNGIVSIVCERQPGAESDEQPTNPRSDQARVANLVGVLQKGEPSFVDGRIVVPLRRTGRIAGGVDLELVAGTAEERAVELLEIVDEAAVSASRYLDWRTAEAGGEAEVAFWNRARTTLLNLHAAERVRDVARIVTNDGRTLLGCERVSMVVRRGSRTEVVAVTGVGRVNPRSNQVRSLAHVARLAITTGQPIVHDGRIPDLPGDTREHLRRYLDESGVGTLRVEPLRDPNHDPETDRRRPTCRGAIVVERSDGPFPPPAARRVERLAEHASVALENALASERILFHGVRSAVGGWFAALRSRRLLTALFVLAVIAGTIAALVLVPWTYRVEGTGQLLPVTQRNVFAPSTGRVEEVYAATGAWVEAGQPVLRMQDDERDMEWLTLKTDLDENVQAALALQAELDDPLANRTRDETIRLRGRLEQYRVEAQGLRNRLDLVEAELDRLVVRAPADGTVTTADLPTALLTRPVERGEVVVELMDDRRDWHVELEIPEHHLGHVLDARRAADGEPLPVEFVLSTHPQRAFTGRLVSIATRTGPSEEHGASARAIVAFDPETLPERRIGADVVARIDCGERCLGYVLFGDFVDYVRRWWW